MCQKYMKHQEYGQPPTGTIKKTFKIVTDRVQISNIMLCFSSFFLKPPTGVAYHAAGYLRVRTSGKLKVLLPTSQQQQQQSSSSSSGSAPYTLTNSRKTKQSTTKKKKTFAHQNMETGMQLIGYVYTSNSGSS